MSWTLAKTDTHYVLERRGFVTLKMEIAREYFDPLSSEEKIEALLVGMDKLDDHARAAGIYAGPDGVDVIGRLP